MRAELAALKRGMSGPEIACLGGAGRLKGRARQVSTLLARSKTQAVPMLASVIGLLYFFMLLFAIAATVLFQDAAYFACVDGGSGDVLAETATGEMWGCGAEACPANMTCQVMRWALRWRSDKCKPLSRSCCSCALGMQEFQYPLCPAGVPNAGAAADRWFWQHWAQPAVHVSSGEWLAGRR